MGGAAIIGASVYVGFTRLDIEVEENAYEAGLQFDAARKKQNELGWRVELPRNVKAGAVVIPVDVKDAHGKAVQEAAVELQIYRMGDRKVRTYRCTSSADGRYTADVNLDRPGYWAARIRVDRRNDSLRFDDTINVQ